MKKEVVYIRCLFYRFSVFFVQLLTRCRLKLLATLVLINEASAGLVAFLCVIGIYEYIVTLYFFFFISEGRGLSGLRCDVLKEATLQWFKRSENITYESPPPPITPSYPLLLPLLHLKMLLSGTMFCYFVLLKSMYIYMARLGNKHVAIE